MRIRWKWNMFSRCPSKAQAWLVCLCSWITTLHLNHLVWRPSSLAVQMTAQLWLGSGFEGISLQGMALLNSGDPECHRCVRVYTHIVCDLDRDWVNAVKSVCVCFYCIFTKQSLWISQAPITETPENVSSTLWHVIQSDNRLTGDVLFPYL